MDLISRQVAIEEIEKWLSFKKIGDKKREIQKDQIETLIDGVVDGSLELNPENYTLVHKLKFPIEGNSPVKVLEYKPRLKIANVQVHLQNVKTSDADGRILAYVQALTSQGKETLKALDTEDYSISQSIAIFFL